MNGEHASSLQVVGGLDLGIVQLEMINVVIALRLWGYQIALSKITCHSLFLLSISM